MFNNFCIWPFHGINPGLGIKPTSHLKKTIRCMYLLLQMVQFQKLCQFSLQWHLWKLLHHHKPCLASSLQCYQLLCADDYDEPCLAPLGEETSPPHLALTAVLADDGEPKKFAPRGSFVPQDFIFTLKEIDLVTSTTLAILLINWSQYNLKNWHAYCLFLMSNRFLSEVPRLFNKVKCCRGTFSNSHW